MRLARSYSPSISKLGPAAPTRPSSSVTAQRQVGPTSGTPTSGPVAATLGAFGAPTAALEGPARASEIARTFAGYSPSVAAALVGSQEVFRVRDETLPTLNPLTVQALASRIDDAAMSVDPEARAAFGDFVRGERTQSVIDHASTLLAWQDYLSDIGSPRRQRVIHMNMRALPGVSELPGVSNYAQRGFALAQSAEDVVVLPDSVPRWTVDRLAAARAAAGLATPKVITETEYDRDRATVCRGKQLQEFYRTPESPNPQHYEMQERFEDKNYTMGFLGERGVNCPKMFYSGPASGLDVSAYADRPVVAKRVRSSGGMGVKLCTEPGQLQAFVDASKADEPIQLQELIRGTDCSKQYFVSEHGAAPITNTDQIIKDGVNHAGNKVLSTIMTVQDNANADLAARLVFEQGYRGYMAVDLMKPDDGGVARVIELNLRKGGVTAPTAIASQLGAGGFVARQVVVSDRQALEALYDRFAVTKDRPEGLVPITICPLDDGTIKTEVVFVSRAGGHDVSRAVAELPGTL